MYMLMYPGVDNDRNFGLSLHKRPYFEYASCEGSGESVHLHRLILAFIARHCDSTKNPRVGSFII